MFIKIRIRAHEALKRIMLGNDHAPLLNNTVKIIYNTIKTAETDEAFANELDEICADAFCGQTAEGYDDLLQLFVVPTAGLLELLRPRVLLAEHE